MTQSAAFTTEETLPARGTTSGARSERRGVLTFSAGDEVYGVDILSIREIIKLREITEVPRAPRFLLGVVTVRGLVLPVVDLRLRLRLDPAAARRAAARILVVVHDGERFGLLVDEVRGVVRFADNRDRAAAAVAVAVARRRSSPASGAIRDGDEERMVILLSLDAVLAVSRAARREARDEGRLGGAPASASRRRRASSWRSWWRSASATGDYALDIMRIKEIINPVPVTPMPEGAAVHRGRDRAARRHLADHRRAQALRPAGRRRRRARRRC